MLHAYYADVSFFLNGRLLPSNSTVLLSDIGEGRNALYCLSDRELCCSSKAGAKRGIWRFPDGMVVQADRSADFYRTRGYSSHLINRKDGVVEPTGVYTCLMPDAEDVLRTLYINVHDAGEQRTVIPPTIEGGLVW
jgi:hypothetical protein